MTTSRMQLAYPREWNRKTVPNFPVELDPQHQLSVGLQSMFMPGVAFYDFARRGLPGTPSGITRSGTSIGAAVNYPAAGNIIVNDSTAIGANMTGDITLAWLGNFVDVTTYRALMSKSNGASFSYDLFVAQLPSPLVPNLVRGNGSAFALYTTGVPFPLDNIPHSAIWTCNAANTSATFYQDGVANFSGAPSSGSGTVPSNSTSDPLYIGQRAGGVTQASGNIQGIWLYNRIITPDEAAWLSAEPFAMLRPKLPRTVSLVKAATTARGLFLPPPLSGLGSGGSFFPDRLA